MKRKIVVTAFMAAFTLAGCSSSGYKAEKAGQEMLEAVVAAPAEVVSPATAANLRTCKMGLQADGSVLYRGASRDWTSEDANKMGALVDMEEKFASYISGPEFSREVGGFLKSFPVRDAEGKKLKISIEERFGRRAWYSVLKRVKIPSLEIVDEWNDSEGRSWVAGEVKPESVRQLKAAVAAAAIREEIESVKLRQGLSKEAEAEMERVVRDMLNSSQPPAAAGN